LITHPENSLLKTTNDSTTHLLVPSSTKSKNVLLKQAKLCLDNKKLDDRMKAHSLNLQPFMTDDLSFDENNAEERRRVFARSRTATTTTNNSDEAK
jgi:hypothetical protein